MPGMRYQPQGLVRPDWTNPITAGLLSAVVGGQVSNWGVGPNGRHMSRSTTSGYTDPNIFPSTSPSSGSMTGLNQVTMVTLARRNNTNGSVQHYALRYRLTGNANSSAMGILLKDFSSSRTVQFTTPGGGVSANTLNAASANPDTIFAAGVWDRTSSATLYLENQAPVSITPATTAIPSNGYTMFLADANGGGINTAFLPYVTLVFARALSSAEITSLYNNIWQVFENTAEYDNDIDVAVAGGDGPTIVSADGSSIGSSNLSSVAQAIFNAFGSSAGATTNTAGATGIFGSSGSSPGAASVAASTISLFYSTGASSGSSSGAAGSVSVYLTNGVSNSTATVSGNAYSIWSVQASTVGAAGNTATGVTLFPVAGDSSGTSTAAGEGVTLTPASGSASGTAIGTSNAAAIASAFYNAIANAVGSSSAVGSGASTTSVSGSASGSATGSGSGVARVATTASTSGTSSAAGGGVILACASGAATGLATVNGLSVAIYGADGISVSAAQVQAITASVAAVVGSSEGHSTVSGITEGGLHYTASGDKFSITLILSPYKLTLNQTALKLKLN